MGRITAPDRLRRVLAVVPWIVAHPGEKVADVADRFGLSEKALLDDLAVVFMVGLPPYSPDSLVDVLIDEDGCVTIDLADYFSRPLRLTPGQGLALLAASEALLSVPGTEDDGPLARALMKLGRSLGVRYGDSGANLEVKLGDVEADVLATLRSAAKDSHDVEITYYSFGRDTVSLRVISPWRVFSDSGSWYVHGWCTKAEGERIFRLDRITDIRATDNVSVNVPVDDGESIGVFHPRVDDPTVTLRLRPAVSWVADAYPCEVIERDDDGLVITLVVTAEAWFYRLLLRLGPDCQILESHGIDNPSKGLSETASNILTRYRT